MCVSCGGSSVPLLVCSSAQLDFSPVSAKEQRRASLRPGNVLGQPSLVRDRTAARETWEKMQRG